jgi:hypothetical protein
MIYEYAITPSLCSDWQDLRYFLSNFKGEQGRLFSDVPRKKWKILAKSAVNQSNWGPVMKNRLKTGIDKLARQSIHRRNYVPEPQSDLWLDHAITAHKDRPFMAIISDGLRSEEDSIISIEKNLDENYRWDIPFDRIIRRRPPEMVKEIMPMLDCSREVVLIDRNFDPMKYRWREFLIELAKTLSQREFSPSIYKIGYHTGDHIDGRRISAHEIEIMCNKKLSKEIPMNMTINFAVWPKEELHDRYVITDVGGIEFGIGLDIYDGSGPEEVRLSRISDDTRKSLWGRCKSRNIDFSLKGANI